MCPLIFRHCSLYIGSGSLGADTASTATTTSPSPPSCLTAQAPWQQVFCSLWKKDAIPPAFAALDLTQLWNSPRDKLGRDLCDFMDSMVCGPNTVRAYPAMVVTANEVNEMVQAAVGPAVEAAVQAAQTSCCTTQHPAAESQRRGSRQP